MCEQCERKRLFILSFVAVESRFAIDAIDNVKVKLKDRVRATFFGKPFPRVPSVIPTTTGIDRTEEGACVT